MAVNGWPFTNFGTTLRNFNSVSRQGVETGVPMAIPRYRFTWLADIIPNDTGSITNLVSEGLQKGHLYTHLKSADHPKPSFKTDTLNSYNRRYKLQTKMEMPGFSMTFHDDSTSFAMALVKECINHANWVGGIGLGGINSLSANINKGLTEYTYGTSGPRAFVAPDRSNLEQRSSLGMKIQDCSRSWLSHVVLYDLGTEPDSINVYVYQNPFLVSVDHTPLDNYDRTGFGEVTLNFEYENYYFMIGQPHSQVKPFIDQVLNIQAPVYRSSNGHALQGSHFDQAMGYAAQCLAQCSDQGVQDFIRPVQEIDTLIEGILSETKKKPVEGVYAPNTNVLPSQSPIANPPKLNPSENANFLADRLERAETNYAEQYASLAVDTPQAQQRRQEIEELRVMTGQAQSLSGRMVDPLITSSTTSAAANTTSQLGGVTPTPIRSITRSSPTGINVEGRSVPLPNNPTFSPIANYPVKNPSSTFADFNAQYMKTFKAGVTK